ncbi:hypothetical protein VIBC2010_01463 [Vibrio caribbeanicus ATCC BAA-2122]|uniref:ABC transmembrane type-1 domain-containing protein n=1 Tax=Vibrio caribbeanicus ATCC BAA-2122 TaxID=796620 RepID=E3BLX4_9VIBR|nr:hypothetical protein VIBC2010_01463 [Vibrio caribbeanicus ATCC BAA-2122]
MTAKVWSRSSWYRCYQRPFNACFLTILLGYLDWRLVLIALLPLPVALVVQITMMRGFRHRQEKYMQIVANMHQAQMEFCAVLV